MTMEDALKNFCDTADEIQRVYVQEQGYVHVNPDKHRSDILSSKWARIVQFEENSRKNERVYAFIALSDFSTKALGYVRTGDIHKPATWKAPAKHARGNVFEENFSSCLTAHGVVYLR